MKAPTSRSTGHGLSSWVSGRFPHWAPWGSSARENRLGYPGTKPGTATFLYLQGDSWGARTPLHSFGPSPLTKIYGYSVTVNAALGTPRKEGEAKSFYRGKLAAQGKGLKSTPT